MMSSEETPRLCTSSSSVWKRQRQESISDFLKKGDAVHIFVATEMALEIQDIKKRGIEACWPLGGASVYVSENNWTQPEPTTANTHEKIPY